jgi:hypothetical protein
MPQFNPDDDSMPNQGIPERLLKIYESTLPVVFPVATLQKIVAMGTEAEPVLNDVKLAVAGITGINPALFVGASGIRYFQDGNDYTSWDRGNEEIYSGSQEVVMASFGAERVLDIRYNNDPSVIFTLALKTGTAVHLKQALIDEYQVRIPLMKGVSQPALFILFRVSN